MSFICEIVPEKDYNFFRSMGLKNFWGNGSLTFTEGRTKWCADRERNAFLVNVGGGHAEVPHFHDLWWNGNVIRLETSDGGSGNYEVGVKIIWFVEKLPVPQKLWEYKDEIVKLVYEALSVDRSWCDKKFLRSISVKFECEPQMTTDDY